MTKHEDEIAEILARHRPVIDQALGLLFPTACGICDVRVPGWAAWDQHLADALVSAGCSLATRPGESSG